MKCCECDADLTQDNIDEVTEMYGVDYAKMCEECACDEWHDDNIAPDDEENDQ